MCSYEFWVISKNTFFTKYLWATASESHLFRNFLFCLQNAETCYIPAGETTFVQDSLSAWPGQYFPYKYFILEWKAFYPVLNFLYICNSEINACFHNIPFLISKYYFKVYKSTKTDPPPDPVRFFENPYYDKTMCSEHFH